MSNSTRKAKDLSQEERRVFVKEFYLALNQDRDFVKADMVCEFPCSCPWLGRWDIPLHGQTVRECAINYVLAHEDEILNYLDSDFGMEVSKDDDLCENVYLDMDDLEEIYPNGQI